MWLLALTVALAADSVEMTGHVVTANFDLPNTAPADTFSLISDPIKLAGIVGGVEILKSEPVGGCERVYYKVPHPVATVKYTLDLCPAADKRTLDCKLVDGPFKSYAATWTISPAASGSTVTYRLDIVSSLLIPSFIVNNSTKKGVENMVTKLVAHDKAQ